MVDIQKNWFDLQEQIKKKCLELKRDPASVKIIAVTKTHPVAAIKSVVTAGAQHIGENKVQEAQGKKADQPGLPVKWHFIGHLQSNKAKIAADLFDWVHSLDKLATAQKLNRHCQALNKKMKVLVQVNTSQEPQKSGIRPNQALDFCNQIQELSFLDLQGLMTIASFTEDENIIKNNFAIGQELQHKLLNRNIPVPELSMGMSHDWHLALAKGATFLRIGSALFGARNYG